MKIYNKVGNQIDKKKTTPNNIWKGGSRGLTYEQVKHFIEVESDSGCKLLSHEYTNSKVSIEIECSCTETFFTSFTKFKNRNKRQCNECANENRRRKQSKTHEDFVTEIESLTNGEFLVKGRYKGDKEPILFYHVLCGREMMLVPSNILQLAKTGGGCAKCSFERMAQERTLTQEEFLKRLYEIVGDEYSAITEYQKSIEKITFRHNMCDNEFSMAPNTFFQGHRCPICAYNINAEKSTKTHDMFISEVENLVGDEYSVLGQYVRTNIKIEMKHNPCGTIYKVTPHKFLSGVKCPKCNLSKGAWLISHSLKKMGLEFVIEKKYDDCRNKYSLPFDFYVQDTILIEYDGDFHFVPARFSKNKNKMKKKLLKTQDNDRKKNNYCIENKIPLVRIPCWEIENCQEILINILMHFDLIDKDGTFDKSRAKDFIVDEDWDHEQYINNYKRTYWLEVNSRDDITG